MLIVSDSQSSADAIIAYNSPGSNRMGFWKHGDIHDIINVIGIQHMYPNSYPNLSIFQIYKVPKVS